MSDADSLDDRDPALIAALLPVIERIHRHYFRLHTEGFDALPDEPVLYVANHNGGLAGPDHVCVLGALWLARGPDAPLYALAHDFAMRHVSPLGAMIRRFGALRADPENAKRALAAGAQVLVYPGGDLDAYRLTRRRDEIVLGDRTGFIKLAQEAGVPIVPLVSHGAHRSAYIFSEGTAIARALGLKRWARIERFPLAFALPWIFAPGPWLPYLPLPFSIQLRALPAITVPPAAEPAHVREQVRAAMQTALDDLAHSAR